MSYASGLAALGAAIAVAFHAYVGTAVRRERAVVDRISLESAVAMSLARQADEVNPPGEALTPLALNGREITVLIENPRAKVDPTMDAPETVLAVLQQAGLMVDDEDATLSADLGGMADLSRRLGLGAAEEDCLRRGLTYGRAPADRIEGPAPAGLTPGDQVDVRASLEREGGRQVLWVRARYTGSAASPWRMHDYRRLQTAPAPCLIADWDG